METAFSSFFLRARLTDRFTFCCAAAPDPPELLGGERWLEPHYYGEDKGAALPLAVDIVLKSASYLVCLSFYTMADIADTRTHMDDMTLDYTLNGDDETFTTRRH